MKVTVTKLRRNTPSEFTLFCLASIKKGIYLIVTKLQIKNTLSVASHKACFLRCVGVPFTVLISRPYDRPRPLPALLPSHNAPSWRSSTVPCLALVPVSRLWAITGLRKPAAGIDQSQEAVYPHRKWAAAPVPSGSGRWEGSSVKLRSAGTVTAGEGARSSLWEFSLFCFTLLL